MTTALIAKPRRKLAKKPDAPCAKINRKWVLLTDLLTWRTAWPAIKCNGCSHPAFGLFAITIHRGIPGKQKTVFRTLCSRCALGNKLDPRKRPWIKMVFEIAADPDYLESLLLIDEALGIGKPHVDGPGKFVAFREQSAEDPAMRARTLLNIFDAPGARFAMEAIRHDFGHYRGTCLRLTRVPEVPSVVS